MIKKKLSKTEILFVVLSLTVALSCLTFYVWYQTELIRLGLENQKAQETIKQLEEEIKSLEAQRSSLLSPERVEKIAREYLQLTEPNSNQLIYEEWLAEVKK
ncbi:MAG: cell division protein FtsL [Candidatus Aminicenantes bacterium]|nr:cell division protein FtsL [Candidatus Aminicenantes bacterium]